MDGVGISIIGRPRPLPGHDTPNPANNTYTLNYEEPDNLTYILKHYEYICCTMFYDVCYDDLHL